MRIDIPTLRSFSESILKSLDTPTSTASTVTSSLLRADLSGFGTHGVGILPLYRDMIADGAIDPEAEPETTQGPGCTGQIDGNQAFGQLTGKEATATGVALAEQFGVGVTGIRDGAHLGSLGEYAEQAAGEGHVFLGFTNSGGGAKNTAPFGGYERKLSTNPIAFGCPTFDVVPFDIVADFATSQVSGSTIREHHQRGESLRDEWTTTASGEPVADPEAFLAGEGALLPVGGRATGHKGFALSVAAELLGGLVGGEAVVGESERTWFANGGAFVVIDPSVFLNREILESRIEALANHLRSDTVRLPGEGSFRRRAHNRKNGIHVPGHRLVPLLNLAEDLSVEPPKEMQLAVDAIDDVPDDVKTW